MKLITCLFFWLFMTRSGAVVMAESKIVQRISYADELENIQQHAVLSAILRVMAGESTFVTAYPVLGEVKLQWPKNPRQPVVMAYVNASQFYVRFRRDGDTLAWSKASFYPFSDKRSPFALHLPSFSEAQFKQLHLELRDITQEKIKEKDKPPYQVYMYDYKYKTKDGVELVVRFQVRGQFYKPGDAWPAHFDRVLINRVN